MSDVVIPYRFVVRRGTAANLATVNEVPLAGEFILATDTSEMKIGDGVTRYNDLPYLIEYLALGALLTGLVISPNSPIVATDKAIEAFGKLQAQINAMDATGGLRNVDGGHPGTIFSVFNLDGGIAGDIYIGVSAVDGGTP